MFCKYYFEVIVLICCFSATYSINNLIEKGNSKHCTIHVANTVINISILNNESEYELMSNNDTYILNMCGPALRCKHPQASACVINTRNETKILGLFNDQPIKKNQLKYKYKHKNEKAETIIDFKCNRHMVTPHLHYDSVINKINYKFYFYTSKICVKMPTQCQIFDVENNLQYDITSLYNENNWVVKNVSGGLKVYLNLCGSLHSIAEAKDNECAYEGTQICLVDQNGKSTNLGVFPSPVQPTENGLTVTFTGGSLCTNITTISTKIDFVCSFNETGPVITSSSNCEYTLKWYTPAACPYSMTTANNCSLQNKRLYFSKDKTQQLSPNLKIKYNICGVLKDTCHGQRNVAVCLIEKDSKKEEEVILGMSNSTVISKDADVYIKLIGELCPHKNVNYSVYIQFQCDYSTQEKLEEISLNPCATKITVFTVSVCKAPDILTTKDCTISVSNSHYNLSSLVLTNNNYEVTDPNDSTKTYLLNLCQPLVYNTNALCDVGSTVCLRNNAEPNKYKRFKSLGNYLASSELQIQDEKLFIQYENVMCPNLHVDRATYKTVIEFECNLQESNIELKSKLDCKYTFLWKTQHACPITDTNITSTIESKPENVELVKQSMDDARNAPLHEIKSTIKPTMEDIAEHTKNVPQEHQSTVKLADPKTKPTMEDIAEHTKNVPQEHQSTAKLADPKTKPITISMLVPMEDTKLSKIFIKDCSLRDSKLNMYNMHSLPKITHVLSKSGKTYEVNICNTEIMCKSMLCLTNLHIALSKQFVIMNFTEDSWCNNRPYTSVIFLKCSNELKEPVVIQEQECSVQLEWNNQAACAFLKADTKEEGTKEESLIDTGKIVALSVGVAAIVVIICLAGFAGHYYFVRRRCRDSSLQLLRCEYSRVKDSTKIA